MNLLINGNNRLEWIKKVVRKSNRNGIDKNKRQGKWK